MFQKVNLTIDGPEEPEVLVSFSLTDSQLNDLVHRNDLIFVYGDPETGEIFCLLSEPFYVFGCVREVLAAYLPNDGKNRARLTLVPADGNESDNIVLTLSQTQIDRIKDGSAVLIVEGKRLNSDHCEVSFEVLLRSPQDTLDYLDVNFASEFPGEQPEQEEEEE